MDIVPGRHLAAVMFADVVGYTSLMQRDEGAALAARHRHRTVLRETVPTHGGRIVQFLGDGSLSLFPSAVEAVRAAIDIQKLLATPPQLPLRIGIDQGEITYDEQGILGDAVNVAARVQALSVAGAVVVTGKIHDELRNQPDLPLIDLGRVRLKGVQQLVALHAVAIPGLRVPSPSEIPRSGEQSGSVGGRIAADDVLGLRPIELLRDRLAAALDSDYIIEGALDAGGMGLVFRGRDRVLDRPVAVKVMRPELTTERAIERFLREARILARLRHPAVVPVHRAGDADGLPFYVMDFLEGETLEEALRRGPMPEGQVLSLAMTLLDGLAAVHAEGVVHRDIKPSNVFLTRTGAVLTDFGIAHTATGTTEDGTGKRRIGTPGYMPPEQEAGGEVTQLTDIYAAGMVFYEALTGIRWSTYTDPADADWSAVPRAWLGPLRRALARSPAERWPRVLAFRKALAKQAGRPPWARFAGVATIAVAIVTGTIAVQRMMQPVPSRVDRVAVFPFETRGDIEASAGEQLAMMVLTTIGTTSGLSVALAQNVDRWWAAHRGLPSFDPRLAAREMKVEYVAIGALRQEQDSLFLELTCYDSTGAIRFSGTLPSTTDHLRSLANRATGELLSVIDPRASHRSGEILSADDQAFFEFVAAELAVARNDWKAAAQHYERAIAQDSNFVTARWRMVNVQRWLSFGRAWSFDPVPELEKIAATNRGRLSEPDSLLLDAQLSTRISERLDRYRAAVTRFPDDELAALLYGDELFHRGALAGRPMDRAAAELQRAVALQRYLAPAYAHLAWLYIRSGERDAANTALERFRSSVQPPVPDDLVLISHAFLERFDTAAAARQRAELFGGTSMDAIDRLGVARIGLAFDLPVAQYELGRLLAMHPLALPEKRADGRIAMALSLLARGRWREGLPQLDSAAVLSPTAELTLQSAEWRVIPAALGLPGSSREALEHGRSELRRLAGPGPMGDRATWALAVDDIMNGDTTSATAWLATRPAAHPALRTTLDALLIASRGSWHDAIERTDSLLERDRQPSQGGDPFVRALLHSRRAEWFEQLAASSEPATRTLLLDSARYEWTWSENLDLVDWVTGTPQSAEVDWVMSPWASSRLALLEVGASACYHAHRALDWWADADAPLAQSGAGLRGFVATQCAQ